MVSPEVLLMLSLLDTGLLLFLAVYFMITLSDLESDYINSRQCSERLNRLTWPRAALLVLLCLLALPSPLLLLPPLPPTLWLLYKATHVPPGATMVHHPPPGNSGLYEPTEVHVRAVLQGKLQESLVLMGHHMASFFLYMWLLVAGLSTDQSSPLPREVPW